MIFRSNRQVFYMTDAHKIDLHMHSTVSDGTDTPEELLARVQEAGIELFALTDHDALKGCDMIRKARKPGDPQFLNGVEFSCRDELGKYHILGYGYDPDSPSILNVVEKGAQPSHEEGHRSDRLSPNGVWLYLS